MARADQAVYTLASNAAPGNGADVTIAGGVYIWMAEGTFGGGNVQLQLKSANGTYINVGTAFTANGASGQIFLPEGVVRVVTTTITNCFAYLAGIG